MHFQHHEAYNASIAHSLEEGLLKRHWVFNSHNNHVRSGLFLCSSSTLDHWSVNIWADVARSLQGRLHFKITVWEVAQGVQEGPGGGHRRTPLWTPNNSQNVDRVREVLRTDRLLSIQQIADTLHMSTFAVHGIKTEDLQMRKVCAKLVPKVLTQDQKELRVLPCQELLDLIKNEPDFLNSVVTGDESWMFEYDPESKR
ncbi:FLJ37770-like protein [Trichonephila clavipes]|nr:FLJ37770-like protein [Trichonephila clavipes]